MNYPKRFVFLFPMLCLLVLLTGCQDSGNGADTGEVSSVDETGTEYTIGVVNIETLKVRGEPDGDSRTVMLLPNGAEVTILAEENGFYRISLQPEDDTAEGYVRKEYLDVD